jgi:hypothetical protein
VHFAMADGSCQYIIEDVELRLLQAFASRDQEEPIAGGGL